MLYVVGRKIRCWDSLSFFLSAWPFASIPVAPAFRFLLAAAAVALPHHITGPMKYYCQTAARQHISFSRRAVPCRVRIENNDIRLTGNTSKMAARYTLIPPRDISVSGLRTHPHTHKKENKWPGKCKNRSKKFFFFF